MVARKGISLRMRCSSRPGFAHHPKIRAIFSRRAAIPTYLDGGSSWSMLKTGRIEPREERRKKIVQEKGLALGGASIYATYIYITGDSERLGREWERAAKMAIFLFFFSNCYQSYRDVSSGTPTQSFYLFRSASKNLQTFLELAPRSFLGSKKDR